MLAMVLFEISDVILFLVVAGVFFLLNAAVVVGGILFLRRGRYWLGSALLLAFAAFYLGPNVYTMVQTHRVETKTVAEWIVPEAPLQLSGRSVLCLPREGTRVSSQCETLYEAHGPSRMISVNVSADVPWPAIVLDSREIALLRRDVQEFEDWTYEGVAYDLVPGQGRATDFDVVIDQRDTLADSVAALGADYLNQVTVYEPARSDQPRARFIHSYIESYRGWFWFFSNSEVLPRSGHQPASLWRYFCDLADPEKNCSASLW